MSPRRSSRARATQPPPVGPQHTTSSSSSTSINRAERSTRSHNKNQSPPTSSTTQRSQSLEGSEDPSKSADLPHTRQRRRGRDDEPEDIPKEPDNDVEEEEDGDAEEITRCICGHSDFPGLPVLGRDKVSVKDEGGQPLSAPESEALSEDLGAFFIQCDSCKVWQHGGCVGLMHESLIPEEYFCEECRKDFHRLHTAPNGQKYSKYLPVLDVSTPRSSSISSADDSTRKREPRSSRQNTNNSSTKRRSTMNSRDAAYDEEELLRRAIEESKGGGSQIDDAEGNRRGKRSRSESEEHEKSSKRQRTGSVSPLGDDSDGSQGLETDNEQVDSLGTNGGPKRIRSAAARNHREKELQDREHALERERQDAAGRRKNRAERRRGDDSDPSESVSPSKQPSQPPAPSSQPVPDTPASHSQENITSRSTSHRKTGRPPTKRGRVGRNQYTRDRDLLPNGNQDPTHQNSPMRSDSRDGDESHHGVNGHNGGNGNGNGETGRPSKPKYMNPHRTTMNEMKRRVAAILEFISQMKAEVGAESGNIPTPPSGSSSVAASAMIRGVEAELAGILAMQGEDKDGGKDFTELSSSEMMGDLLRSLSGWQSEFGKYGEK